MHSLNCRWPVVSLAVLMVGAAAAAADPQPIQPEQVQLGRPVDFEQDVLPVLENNCVACHNSAIAESKLNLEDLEGILKGGKRGAALAPKEPDKSLLYQVAARAKEPLMPPLPNKVQAAALTPRELGILRQWILEGAAGSAGAGTSRAVNWQPLPAELKAIHSVALDPAGRLAAVGRANRIAIYDVITRRHLTDLTDPALAALEQNDRPVYGPGTAHRDFVHALAFNHDGTLLASGGYRVVKLWERPVDPQVAAFTAADAPTAVALSAGGKWLAVAAGTGIQVINTQTGHVERTLTGHTAPVNGLSFLPSAADQAAVDAALAQAEAAVHAAQAQARLAGQALRTFEPKREKLDEAQAAERRTQLQTAEDNARNAVAAAWQNLRAAQEARAAFDRRAAEESRLYSASEDKSIRVWKLADGTQIAQIDTPAAVNDVVANVDGSRIVSAGADNVIRVWPMPAAPDERPDKALLELTGHGQAVTALDFLRGTGNQIVSGSLDGTARVWNIDNGSAVRTVNHGGPVRDVAGSPDGQRFASAGESNIARLWNNNGQQVAELKGDLDAGRRLVAVTEDQTVARQRVALADAAQKAAEQNLKDREDGLKKAQEAKAGAEKTLNEVKEKAQQANDVLKAAQEELAQKTDDEALKKKVDDAQKAAAAEADNLKKATDAFAAADRAVARGDESFKQAQAALEAAKLAKQQAEAAQQQIDAQLAEAQKAAAEAGQPVRRVAFASDGNMLITSGDDGAVRLWSAETGQPLDVFRGHQALVTALACGPGSKLVSAAADKSIILWDANPEWKLVGVLGPQGEDPLDVTTSKFVDRVLALDFSRDGKLLATGGGEPSRSGELYLWDVAGKTLLREIPDAHSDTIFGLEFSRDGKYIVSGSADKFVKVHEVESGKHVRSYEGHTHHVLDVSWKADGSWIVSAGADNAIKVWNVETGEQIRTISNFAKEVTSIQFLGASEDVVSCGGDKTVRYHRVSNGQNIRNFGGGTDFMYAAAATPNARLVVAGGEDGVFRIWNGENGQAIASFDPPFSPLDPAAANTQASAP